MVDFSFQIQVERQKKRERRKITKKNQTIRFIEIQPAIENFIAVAAPFATVTGFTIDVDVIILLYFVTLMFVPHLHKCKNRLIALMNCGYIAMIWTFL